MNIVRACSSALDLGHYVGWRMQLGEPHDLCDVFNLLREGGWIDAELADNLQHVMRFKDKAIRDDLALQCPETVEVITLHLGEFLRYTEALLLKDGTSR